MGVPLYSVPFMTVLITPYSRPDACTTSLQRITGWDPIVGGPIVFCSLHDCPYYTQMLVQPLYKGQQAGTQLWGGGGGGGGGGPIVFCSLHDSQTHTVLIPTQMLVQPLYKGQQAGIQLWGVPLYSVPFMTHKHTLSLFPPRCLYNLSTKDNRLGPNCGWGSHCILVPRPYLPPRCLYILSFVDPSPSTFHSIFKWSHMWSNVVCSTPVAWKFVTTALRTNFS